MQNNDSLNPKTIVPAQAFQMTESIDKAREFLNEYLRAKTAEIEEGRQTLVNKFNSSPEDFTPNQHEQLGDLDAQFLLIETISKDLFKPLD